MEKFNKILLGVTALTLGVIATSSIMTNIKITKTYEESIKSETEEEA